MQSEQEAKVYIVDDDPEWCNSLKWLLESVHLKTETYNDAATFLKSYKHKYRGCLLLDVRMPGINGLQVQEQLNNCGSQLPIIIISGHGDIPLAVRAMKAGAFDFITKPVNEQQLLDLVYSAIQQDKYRQDTPDRAAILKRYTTLTGREREIMEYVVEGETSKEIAAKLGISVKTIELHRSNLMHKLEVKNLAELCKIQPFLRLNRHL